MFIKVLFKNILQLKECTYCRLPLGIQLHSMPLILLSIICPFLLKLAVFCEL